MSAIDYVSGYLIAFTLPIFCDGRLIGRVDAKHHRDERRLALRHVAFEPTLPDRGVGWPAPPKLPAPWPRSSVPATCRPTA